MKDIDAIIFDLDGVLWSTIESCVAVLAEEKKLHPDILYDITASDVKSSMGKSFDEIVKIYYSYLEPDKAKRYAKDAFDKNVKRLLEKGGEIYPKVKEVIKQLAEKYKLYIVSNCIEGYIESFFKSSQLESYFSDYESNGRTKLSKGENIKLIIERNHLNHAVYVGDTDGDKIAAKEANILFIYAEYGFGMVQQYDYKIEQISDLLTLCK